GTSLTITGNNLTGATSILVGGKACASFGVISISSATCVTPSGSAGTASVVVTTANGTSSANTLYSYTTTPAPNPSPSP
ncbi:MAG TPA: cell surface receptor IPT/TIG domain-containing protein, partial [Methylococcaceae bacterium]|nr:cell surface receptor IPT/TIG domain-containing protein [Methylococcaceae bacterium]